MNFFDNRSAEEREKFLIRNSLYGMNPTPPTTEQLIEAGVFKNPNTAEDCRKIWNSED